MLEPLVPKEEDKFENFVDIKAGDLLQKSRDFRINGYSLKKFSTRIEELGIDNFPELNGYGKYTFFFPVDSAFEV